MILKADDISKIFKNKTIIKNINLSVEQGKVIGLLGPNGAGKTTCFKIIAGLIKPNTGQILIDNTNITNYNLYKRGKLGINYLPQEPSILRGLSVEDNIKVVLEFHCNSKEDIKQKLEQLLQEFNLESVRYNNSVAISGGQRRRLEIARTMAGKSRLLLLDEPFSGVDPIAAENILQIIRKLKKKNIGILITDHNIKLLLQIIDYGYVIYDGKILMEGDAKTIMEHSKARELYLGEAFSL